MDEVDVTTVSLPLCDFVRLHPGHTWEESRKKVGRIDNVVTAQNDLCDSNLN